MKYMSMKWAILYNFGSLNIFWCLHFCTFTSIKFWMQFFYLYWVFLHCGIANFTSVNDLSTSSTAALHTEEPKTFLKVEVRGSSGLWVAAFPTVEKCYVAKTKDMVWNCALIKLFVYELSPPKHRPSDVRVRGDIISMTAEKSKTEPLS